MCWGIKKRKKNEEVICYTVRLIVGGFSLDKNRFNLVKYGKRNKAN